MTTTPITETITRVDVDADLLELAKAERTKKVKAVRWSVQGDSRAWSIAGNVD